MPQRGLVYHRAYMRCWQFLCIAVLNACITTKFQSSGTHVDNAKEALSRRDYDKAEREFEFAAQRAEGPGVAWVQNEVARGRALIAIERMRKDVPLLRANTKPTFHDLGKVNDLRVKLRELGGDAALDADLVGVLGTLADRWMSEQELRAAERGEILVMPTVERFAFGAIQIVAVIRIAGELTHDPFAWFASAALAWLVAFARWVLRLARISLAPRADLKPG